MPRPHLLALLCALSVATNARAQVQYGAFELQMGVYVPTTPMLREQSAHVQRSPGGSIGLLVYSYLENPVGFRVRSDFAFGKMQTSSSGFQHTEMLKDLSVGLDAVPRFARIGVKGLEARLYVGAGLRVIIDGADDVTIVEGTGVFNALDLPSGNTVGLVGRAGWFIRRPTRGVLLSLDLAYQIGDVSGFVQHDLQFRIGLGSY
jgi:hypothetical protein